MSVSGRAGFSKRRLGFAVLGVIVVAALMLIGADRLVASAGDGRCFADVAAVPKRPVAMVLGCPKYDSWSGLPNVYYANRVRAAAELYRAGRCERILVSSDADAPDMQADIAAAGVPASALFHDAKGVRTRESFLSAAKRFGITGGIVVSQRYHNERSLYIAAELGGDWVAYDAGEISGLSWWRAHAREALARVKAVIDRYAPDDAPQA